MKAKKLMAVLLSTAMLSSLAACSNAGTENSISEQLSTVSQTAESSINEKSNEQSPTVSETAESSTDEKPTESSESVESNTDENSTEQSTEISENIESSIDEKSAENSEQEISVSAENKTLVLYFSGGNSKNADVISSATQRQDDYYATQYLAELIHSEVGGELVPIIPTNAYPIVYDETADKAKDERDNDERPQFETLGVNIEDYDTIYVGYPMWWYTLPMVMYTFFDTYDFSGKTIIPFNTHLGSGDGGTYQTIKEFEPNATIKDGLAVSGSAVFDSSTEQNVKNWLAGLE